MRVQHFPSKVVFCFKKKKKFIAGDLGLRRNNKAQDILEKFHVCPTFFDIRGVTLVRKTLSRILLLPVDFACHKQIPSKGLKSDKYVL